MPRPLTPEQTLAHHPDWTRVRDQRRETHCFTLDAYCTNPRCEVRAVTLDVKDLDDTLLARRVPRCPLCRRAMIPGYPTTEARVAPPLQDGPLRLRLTSLGELLGTKDR